MNLREKVKILRLLLFVVLAGFIFFALSNLLGLSGENEPIPVKPGTSNDYVKVSKILQNKCVDCHSPGSIFQLTNESEIALIVHPVL
jgi:cytochrome c peroxidase